LRSAIIKLNANSETAKLAASEKVTTSVLKEKGQKEIRKIMTLESVFQKWIELQDCVVGLFNSEKAQLKANRENNGVKQLLERKEGLFRMKMMGKRVLVPINSRSTMHADL
jgi:DNA-directed RNA polymerase I subunit RPA1